MRQRNTNKLSVKTLSIAFFTLFVGIMMGVSVKAAEPAQFTLKTGTFSDPHIFTVVYWGYGDTTNNAFSVPSSSTYYEYFKITAPSTGGYIESSDDCTWYRVGNTPEKWLLNTPHWIEPNKEYILGFKPGKSISLKLHQHAKTNTKYQEYGDTCQKIEYCKCGYQKDATAYSVTNEAHDYKTISTTPATCTKASVVKKECKKCGCIVTKSEGSPLGHNFNGTYKKESEFYHYIKCSRCSETKIESHSFTTNGATKICKKCGYSYKPSYGTGSSSGTSTSNTNARSVSKLSVTKYSKNNVHIVFRASDANASDKNIRYEIYASGKKIKTLSPVSYQYSTYWYQYTYKGKKAGSKKYYIKTVNLANKSSAISKKVKPKANKNQAKSRYKYGRNATLYSALANTWRPSLITKKGRSYTVKGFFINNHILKLSNIAVKVYVYYIPKNGFSRVLLGTKKIRSGRINPQSIKNTRFTIKSSKLCDWNNGALGYYFDFLGWKY